MVIRLLAAVLRGRGPDRLGFWSLGRWYLSRRTICQGGEWWTITTLGTRDQSVAPIHWWESSRDLDLP